MVVSKQTLKSGGGQKLSGGYCTHTSTGQKVMLRAMHTQGEKLCSWPCVERSKSHK